MSNAVEIYAAATSDRWAKGLSGLPEHMQDSIVRYILQGVHPGDFLTALLCNDLFGALRRADDKNMSALPAYGRFLYNCAPAACYGSPGKVQAWIAEGGIVGHAKGKRTEAAT